MSSAKPTRLIVASLAVAGVIASGVVGAVFADGVVAHEASSGFMWGAFVALPVLLLPFTLKRLDVGLAGAVFASAVAIWITQDWVTSQGSTAGIGVIFVPPIMLGVVFAFYVIERIVMNRVAPVVESRAAGFGERCSALAIDCLVVSILCLPAAYSENIVLVPLGIVFSLFYLVGPVLAFSRTFGQKCVGLRILDSVTRETPRAARLLFRGFIIAVELIVLPPITFFLLLIAEVFLTAMTRSSLVDRMFHTTVHIGEERKAESPFLPPPSF